MVAAVAAVAAEYVFTPQGSQSGCAESAWYLPAGQSVHAAAVPPPSVLNVPAEQLAQSFPAVLYLPAAQLVHAVNGATVDSPASQLSHDG